MGALYNDLSNACSGKEIDLITTQTLEQQRTKERAPIFIDNIKSERVRIYG